MAKTIEIRLYHAPGDHGNAYMAKHCSAKRRGEKLLGFSPSYKHYNSEYYNGSQTLCKQKIL